MMPLFINVFLIMSFPWQVAHNTSSQTATVQTRTCTGTHPHIFFFTTFQMFATASLHYMSAYHRGAGTHKCHPH
jgi:hypothetical protein